MNENVSTLFRFKNKNGTNIIGSMIIPFIKGIAYKPYNIAILSGELDIVHNSNLGEKSKRLREKKNLLMRKYGKKNGSTYKIEKPFFINDGEATGLVSLMGILNGYNSNREGSIYLLNDRLHKYKAAKLFQNLKSTPLKPDYYIDINQAINKYQNYFEDIISRCEMNIKTSSANIMEEKND